MALGKGLSGSFGIDKFSVPEQRIQEFQALASQTSMQERESLYSVVRHVYTGEGDVWDIGCAAGGSSFCLGAGLQDNRAFPCQGKTVKCFDLFGGYSRVAFAKSEKFSPGMEDIEIFNLQTQSVSDFVKAEKLNLVTDLAGYSSEGLIEIAHIDAAKSLKLWLSIFDKISTAIIPGKTIWIFQDFERCRLPWQVYSLAEMRQFGEIIGGALIGTLYFRFNSEISSASRKKVVNDDFLLDERINNVNLIYDEIEECHADFFPSSVLADCRNTTIAYCHYWSGDKILASKILEDTSSVFLEQPGNEIYLKEIGKGC